MEFKQLKINGTESKRESWDIDDKGNVDNINHWIYLTIKYQQAKQHQGTSYTKSRGEVRGGGAKPYAQKGTGRARRGTNRTPLRVGGSVIFGPKPRDFSIDINKDVIKKALRAILTQKTGNAFILESNESELKTKSLTDALALSKNQKVMIVLDDEDWELEKACRNIKSTILSSPHSIDAASLLNSQKVVFTQKAFEKTKKVLSLS